ncbi:hypothetical protein C7S15_5222 [Burkholderia cepacia]|nr:hypothetical protein [Burkholderia cepacia]
MFVKGFWPVGGGVTSSVGTRGGGESERRGRARQPGGTGHACGRRREAVTGCRDAATRISRTGSAT